MKGGILEMQHLARPPSTLFASTEATEVFSRLGDDIGSQLHFDAPLGRTTNGDVEKDDRVAAAAAHGFESITLVLPYSYDTGI
jgi:hypothetical protein